MIDVHPFIIFLAAIFTSNILLSNFLGMCSFLSISKEVESSLGLGMAVVFVTVLTAAVNYVVYYQILVPFDIVYLQYIIFIIVIAATVQLTEIFIERFSPALYYSLGIFLPLITVNCAIFGVALFMIIRKYSFMQTIGFAAGSGLGWLLAIMALAGIRQRIKEKMVPAGLQGAGITLIITGIMALAFVGFSGSVIIQ
ncbi:MAG: Rnf-Nqr domain containing protein [Candidatus Cloacimonadales bacterium]|jgi:Na+-transporting NADH:ubiquinone oxidoreductase subunit E|nr:NADH:ubiquinone reductase (Na(+)-transporting) subunit E [Candidatus Cloacimonadota bacterium]MDD2651147.1 Rnf-Nqr domain containing protein [Candidatus Cloacimonadota bacterium]MDX9976878.1 Rnf-Nqr domain containing protein [Candidatus Cloacimonadales bacterium]